MVIQVNHKPRSYTGGFTLCSYAVELTRKWLNNDYSFIMFVDGNESFTVKARTRIRIWIELGK